MEKKTHPTGHLLKNRYRLVRVIGAGDFGTVYLAEELQDTTPLRHVALKQLPMQMIVNCERQADMRVSLLHPAIPRIYGYFFDDDHAYLVMEYIAGKNLEVILDETEGFLAEAVVVQWAVELCDVLTYLHTHPHFPMVFRDLKPNNLVLDENGHVHPVDFELARVFPPGYFQSPTPEFSHMQAGLDIGTEGYSPPEQYRGFVTPQSDLYALGATLHHLLTRRDPRKEPPHTFQDFPVRALNPHVSPALEAVVMKALEIEMSQRFASAEELKTTLDKLSNRMNAPIF